MYFFRFLSVLVLTVAFFVPSSLAAEPSPVVEPTAVPVPTADPVPVPSPSSSAVPVASEAPIEDISGGEEGGYLSPDEFFSVAGDEYAVSMYAVQSGPNTPVTSADGLKGILLDLFGSYNPTITQLRYEANNGYYTYVNDISPDFPWLCSAGIFALIIFCLFRMGGSLLCKQ